MASAPYDDDIVLWSEQQAEIIRRLSATRRDLPNELDVENVAEEIESVGRSETAAVESSLRLLLLHVIKIASASEAEVAAHWYDEAENFGAEAFTRFAPSMAQRIDLDKLWRLAVRQATASLGRHGQPLPDLPTSCPYSIEELVRESLDLEGLRTKLPAKPSAN